MRWLRLGSNGNITDKGIGYIALMQKLEYLRLESLPGVKNPDAVLEKLTQSLTDCKIEYPPFTNQEEDGQE